MQQIGSRTAKTVLAVSTQDNFASYFLFSSIFPPNFGLLFLYITTIFKMFGCVSDIRPMMSLFSREEHCFSTWSWQKDRRKKKNDKAQST